MLLIYFGGGVVGDACTGTINCDYSTESSCKNDLFCHWINAQEGCAVKSGVSTACSKFTSQNVCSNTAGCTWNIVQVCGNGIIEGTEQCDSSNLNGQTCVSKGFSGGTLSCNSDCTFNANQCTSPTLTCSGNINCYYNDIESLCKGDLSCRWLGIECGIKLGISTSCSQFTDPNKCSNTEGCTWNEPDNTPPIISIIQSTTTKDSATITWETDEPSDSSIRYDVDYNDLNLETGTTFSPSPNTLTKDHSVTISSLQPDTTYYYIVYSKDASNNLAKSISLSNKFKTLKGISSPNCGNSIIDVGEDCDTSNLNGQTCQSKGFAGGTLLCDSDCSDFNTNQCAVLQEVNNLKISTYGSSILLSWKYSAYGSYGSYGDNINTFAVKITGNAIFDNLKGLFERIGTFLKNLFKPSQVGLLLENKFKIYRNNELISEGKFSEYCNDNNCKYEDKNLNPGTYNYNLKILNNDESKSKSYSFNSVSIQKLPEPCKDECSQNGLRQCYSAYGSYGGYGSYGADSYRTCGNYDSDSCLEWSTVNSCNTGETCKDGSCVPAAPICGNGVIEGTEQCDTSNLNGQTCQSMGYSGGTLSCNSDLDCIFNTNQCTSLDNTPPIISIIQSAPTKDSATITWETDEPSDTSIRYDVDYDDLILETGTALSPSPNSLVKTHSATISSLQPDTTYYYIVYSKDSSNNLAKSVSLTNKFKTLKGISSPICGNGVIEGTEQCDTLNLNAQTCISKGYSGGTLKCDPDCIFDIDKCISSSCTPNWICGAWSCISNQQKTRTCTDENECKTDKDKPITVNSCSVGEICQSGSCVPAAPICGNGVIEGTEQCDGANLNGETCISKGYSGGTLKCDPDCIFDIDKCMVTIEIYPKVALLNLHSEKQFLVYGGTSYNWTKEGEACNVNQSGLVSASAFGYCNITATDITGKYDKAYIRVIESPKSEEIKQISSNSAQLKLMDNSIIDISLNQNISGRITIRNYDINPIETPNNLKSLNKFLSINAEKQILDNLIKVVIKINYDNNFVTSNNINESTLKTYYYSEQNSLWVAYPSNLGISSYGGSYGYYVSTEINHLSLFGLFGETKQSTAGGESGSGSGGGGGGSGSSSKKCLEDWKCDPWSNCINGKETRTCKDANFCNRQIPIVPRPSQVSSCLQILQPRENQKSNQEQVGGELERQEVQKQGNNKTLIYIVVIGLLVIAIISFMFRKNIFNHGKNPPTNYSGENNLIKLIRNLEREGYSEESIKEELYKKGWKKEDINNIFKNL